MLIVRKLNNFNKVANKVTLAELKKYILPDGDYAVELFEDEKVIHLNIPHGNIYSECNEKEWKEVLGGLRKLGLEF
ncbi:MAG: hypothetical protein WC676_06600 [Candidatus Omnitrophota bacterium]